MGIVKSIETNHYKHMTNRGWDKTYWCFDVHGTILKPNYEFGNIPKEFYPMAKEVLQMISKMGDVVMILYTCSHPHEIEQYVEYFKENGIDFSYVNENPEIGTNLDGYGCYDKKPYMNVLFEDKASFNAETEWEDVYYFLSDIESNINSRNEKLLKGFEDKHISEGGQMPKETGLTNLVSDAINRRDYKIYGGGGYDINADPIKKYDVVLWTSLSNDPYFMVVLDVSEGDSCDLYRCNDNGIIEIKLI